MNWKTYNFAKNKREMKKPLILVTNDDGISAPGIKALIEVAMKLGEVVVVAPDSPQSGQGHAITLEQPLRLHPVNIYPGIQAWECSGTPVDCVKLAKNILLKDREVSLCVSGINHGSNAAINILYSGTLSAAMEASLEKIPSIGFSLLDFNWDADFEPCKEWVSYIMEFVLTQGIPMGNLLNVNIPAKKDFPIQGLKVCKQANSRWVEEYVTGIDPRGQKYYWLTGKFVNEDENEDTDIKALQAGYISVVPSHHDLTNYKSLPSLKVLEK